MKTDEAVKILDEMAEACLRIDSTSGEALAWKAVRSKVNSHDDLVSALEEYADSFEHLLDWLNGTDAVADYAHKHPAEFDRQSKAMGRARAALKKAKE